MPFSLRPPSIPPDDREGLLALADLSDAQVAELQAKLQSAPPLLERDAYANLDPVAGVLPEKQSQIVGALLFLHSILASAAEFTVPDLVDIIGPAFERHPSSSKLVARLQSVLPPFLDIESLKLRSKAVDLHVDHSQSFQSARIFTDVRPVFSTTSPDTITGALVYHTLKINWFGDLGARESYFALDDQDIAMLKEVVTRAEAKSKAIRSGMVERLKLETFGDGPKG